jgi:hypothetical protein
MKKILLISSLFLLFSCGNNDTVTIDKQEYNKLKGVKQNVIGKFPYGEMDDLSVVEIDSCEYIVCNAFRRKDITITHKGNCKLCAKRKLKTKYYE